MKKLRLRREAIRALSPLDLAHAIGGQPRSITPTHQITCPTVGCPTRIHC
jgi:hypothetical protein